MTGQARPRAEIIRSSIVARPKRAYVCAAKKPEDGQTNQLKDVKGAKVSRTSCAETEGHIQNNLRKNQVGASRLRVPDQQRQTKHISTEIDALLCAVQEESERCKISV